MPDAKGMSRNKYCIKGGKLKEEPMNKSKKDNEAEIKCRVKPENEEEIPAEKDKAKKKEERSPEEELRALLEAKEKEAAENFDRLLRTQAEFENYKKRIEKEKADTIKFCNESIIKELLPSIDGLEMALEHAQNSNDSKPLMEGVEMVLNQMLKSLEKFDVTSFSSVGETFDPNCHEAMMRIESDEHDANSIISEFQKGYFFHNRLLRPAKVSVASSSNKEI